MKDYNPIVRFYLLPYIVLSTTVVLVVAFFTQKITENISSIANFLHLHWINAGWLFTASAFLIVAVIFRYSALRLPDLIERKPTKKTQRIRPSVTRFMPFIIMVTVSGLLLGSALERFEAGNGVINIDNLNELKKHPQNKYFYYKGKSEFVSEESFFYYRYTSYGKYKSSEKIGAYYGGRVTSDINSKDAFLFIADDYLLGGEKDTLEEVRVANVALEHLRRDFNKFLDNGGYLKEGNIFQALSESSNLVQKEKYILACCNKHYGITDEPSSIGSLLMFFSIVFYCMSLLPALIERKEKVDVKKLKAFMAVPSLYEKLFKFRYTIGGIKQYAPDDPTYKAVDYKIKKEHDFRYCEKCGERMKWVALANEDKTVDKVWGCRNPSCKN